jgi:hypothetical protein
VAIAIIIIIIIIININSNINKNNNRWKLNPDQTFNFKKYCAYIISVKKERVGLGGSRMGTKKNKISKAGRQCSWECYEKKLKHTVIQKYFCLKF